MADISQVKLPNNQTYNIVATKLDTQHSIDGVSFDGSANIVHYGECSSDGTSPAKTVQINNFVLATGARVIIKFTEENTGYPAHLNVNGTGSTYMRYKDAYIQKSAIKANGVYEFVYDGEYYQLVGELNTDTNTHYTTHIYAGSGSSSNASTTNGNTKIAVADNTTVAGTAGSITIKGTGSTTVSSDDSGVISINSTDNNTTYTIASGTNNGQIKVTPSVGDAYNVSVKGLGGAAYKSEDYYATASHNQALSTITGADDLKAIEALTGTAGFLKKTAANTWSLDNSTYVPSQRTINNKPLSANVSLSASDVGAIAATAKGANSGVAELDANGKVPSSQLPSYVDDVLEYSAKANFPATGETGKIYVDTATNLTYRWGGSAYVEISPSLALGTTSSTAYRGDYGNTAYTHATDSSRLTTAKSSGLYKIAVTAQGHVASVTAVEKADITALGIPGQNTNTTYTFNGGTNKFTVTPSVGDAYDVAVTPSISAVTTSANGLMISSDKSKLDGMGMVSYGTCSTAAGTAAKVVDLSNDYWQLKVGSIVGVKFTNTNTASNVTLNVNNSGAKNIWYNNAKYTGQSADICGYANRYTFYMYDGTYWVWLNKGTDNNSTYAAYSFGIGYGTCATAEATAAKVVTLANYALHTGGITAIKFTYAVPANATLNINSKGAKNLFYRGSAITANIIKAGDTAYVIYDGTQYHLLGIDRVAKDAITGLSISGRTITYTKADGGTGTLTTQDTTYSDASTDAHGLMTAEMVTKLNGLNPSTTTPKAAGTAAVGSETAYARGDHVHPLQTSVSGNAGTATKLASKKTIDGVEFDGSANIVHYGVCDEGASVAAKLVDCAGYKLETGSLVYVRFTNTNSAAVGNITLNVNNTGAKHIRYRNGNLPGTGYLRAGATYAFIYDGTYYQFLGDLDTTTTNATQLQFNGGIKAWSTAAIPIYQLIVAGSDGLYKPLNNGSAFDITHPILYLSWVSGNQLAAGGTTTSVYYDINITITTTQALTLTAHRPVFLMGSLNGKMFTPISTTPLTQTIPTSVDHVHYMLLGYAYNTTAMKLVSDHPIFEYRGGKFRLHEENDMGTWAYWKYNASTDSVDLIFE